MTDDSSAEHVDDLPDELPDDAARAFDRHEAFDLTEGGYRVATTAFEGIVTATPGPEYESTYEVRVTVPTLEAATADHVGEAVANGWFETLERRLEDAPQATRADVALDGMDVERGDVEVTVTYRFTWGNADRAADISKAFVEYVEGTYVEGVVPGYEYVSPVANLLQNASQGDGGAGGTPL